MSFFPAILGLILSFNRVYLKALPVIGQFNRCSAQRTGISNYLEASGGSSHSNHIMTAADNRKSFLNDWLFQNFP